MADGIRLDLQEALARGPSGIPNLEPLFAPGAIPPVFDEAPEVQEGPGFAPEEGPIALPGTSVGQPVPPVSPNRAGRFKALLGNFIQSFGAGLQAAARAPSGAEFAAAAGAALSAPEERRQQQVRESLLRANQAFREQFARERAELDAERFEFTQQQAEAARIERDLDRAERQRERTEGRRTRGMRDILESNRARRGRAGTREFQLMLQRQRLKATAEEGKKGRQLQRELATTRAAGREGLSVKDAYSIAARNVQVALGAEPLLESGKTIKSFAQASREIQQQAEKIFQDANGRKPSKEELAANEVNIDRLRPFIKEIGEAVQSGTATEQELRLVIKDAVVNNEINEAEARLLANGFGLALPPTSALDRIRGRKAAQIREESETVTRPGRFPSLFFQLCLVDDECLSLPKNLNKNSNRL